MKSKIIISVVVIVLSSVAVFFIISSNSSSIKKSEVDFRINDTSLIKKIVILEGEKKIVLYKKANFWRLNNIYSVNNLTIKNILLSFTLLELKTPVPKNAKNSLYKKLKNSKKVIVYDKNNNQIKSFFVGKQTTNKTGNYMLLEGVENPYIIHIASIKEDLNFYYNTDEMFWRDKTIFRYKISEINQIEVIYPKNDTKSFVIQKEKKGAYFLKNNLKSEDGISANKENAEYYLSHFSKVNLEKFHKNNEQNFIDSLNLLEPEFIISITDKNNITSNIKAFNKIENNQIDTDYFIAIFNNKEVIIAKYYNFDLLLKSYKYFL